MSEDQFVATLVGSALGDTLGMPIEGWRREQIQRYVREICEPIAPIVIRDAADQIITQDEYGPLYAISAHLSRGNWTDDTHLMVATARALVEAKDFDLHVLAKHSVALYATLSAQWPTLSCFGKTTTTAFERLAQGSPPTASGVASKVPGNGPALKMAPVGLYMHATGQYEAGLRFAQDAGKMTHLDPRSVAAGVIQAHAIYALLQGMDRDAFLDSLIEVGRRWETSAEQGKQITLTARLQWVQEHVDADLETAYQVLGPGWAVTKNYPFTIFLLHHFWDDPLAGLLATVNFGGDCDSTAALYGACCGALHGSFFPSAWVKVLENVDELVRLGKELYACA